MSQLTAVRQSGSNGARRSGARTGFAVTLVTSSPPKLAARGTTEPPHLFDDLPDNWREIDSYASWLEACAEMRRKAGGK
jgi:hypothetical protein